MMLPTTVRPSLVRIITLRLAITSVMAMLLQVGIVVARAYLNEDDLNRSYVMREARKLFDAVRPTLRGPLLKQLLVPPHYAGRHADIYAFRILLEDGKVIGQHNSAMLTELSPWRDRPSRTQDLWLLDLDLERKLYVAGGLRQRVGGKDVWVEVATRGDPDRV